MRALYHPHLHAEYIATLQPADMTERECNWEFIKREGFVPNYLDEKNPGPAHELIEVLRGEGWDFYHDWIAGQPHSIICTKQTGGETDPAFCSLSPTFCRAVAEAYLKVRGEWIE